MNFSKSSRVVIFTQLILLFRHYQESVCVPLPVEVYDVYQEEIKNLRAHSWNTSHGQPDYAVGDLVSSWTSDSGVFPEEMGSYLEGDILFLEEKRNGIIDRNYRWPGGVVYYRIDARFSLVDRRKILLAMEEYHRYTCVRFQPATGHERDYVVITNDRSGCWAAVGRTGRRQIVNLQAPGCTKLMGTIIHELMHSIGFWHEQSRLDRDKYIQILWNNVRAENRYNFNKAWSTTFGVPYDYFSVMHYSASAFSRNGRPTIIPRRPGISLGQRQRLSPGDIAKINAMYNCRN